MLAEIMFMIGMYSSTFYQTFDVPAKCEFRVSTQKCRGEYGCEWHGESDPISKTITINANHWEQIPSIHRKELVYHELGHCELNLSHSDKPDIMRNRKYSSQLDGSNWDELIERMKKQWNPNL